MVYGVLTLQPWACNASSSSGWVLALALDWLSSRANNVKGGRRNTSTRTVEPVAPGAGETKHCMHATYSYRSALCTYPESGESEISIV